MKSIDIVKASVLSAVEKSGHTIDEFEAALSQHNEEGYYKVAEMLGVDFKVEFEKSAGGLMDLVGGFGNLYGAGLHAAVGGGAALGGVAALANRQITKDDEKERMRQNLIRQTAESNARLKELLEQA